jgi:hypothetical protein
VRHNRMTVCGRPGPRLFADVLLGAAQPHLTEAEAPLCRAVHYGQNGVRTPEQRRGDACRTGGRARERVGARPCDAGTFFYFTSLLSKFESFTK